MTEVITANFQAPEIIFVDDVLFSDVSNLKNKKEQKSRKHQAYEDYLKILKEALTLGASDIHIIMEHDMCYVEYRINKGLIIKNDPRHKRTFEDIMRHVHNSRQSDKSGGGDWKTGGYFDVTDDIVIDGKQTRWRFHSAPNHDSEHSVIVIRQVNVQQQADYRDIDDYQFFSKQDLKLSLIESSDTTIIR